MKAVRFLSRIILICNICFVLFVIFSHLETSGTGASGAGDVVEKVPFFKEIIIILGFPAIILNFLMCSAYLFFFVSGKKRLIPKILAVINSIFLLLQIYYFFIYKG